MRLCLSLFFHLSFVSFTEVRKLYNFELLDLLMKILCKECLKVLYEHLQPLMSSKRLWTLLVQKYLDYQYKNVKYKSSPIKSVIKIMI